MDEFELIARCFRDRVLARPGSVLGIGDDAALVDTGGLPLAHARATTPFRDNDDGAATAGHAFGAAFIRLAAHAVRPRWATLGLTLESGAPERIESFAAAAAAVCQTCGVELIGGDTTRGPGRVTVFALGTRTDHPLQTAPQPPATAVAVCLPLPPACAPENAHAVADLVSVCLRLTRRGTDIQCDDSAATDGDAPTRALKITVHTDAAGEDALRAVADRQHLVTIRAEADG